MSTVSRGITATPTPAATRPCTVGLSFERNAQCGSIPSARKAASTGAIARAVAEADQRLLGDLAQRRRARRRAASRRRRPARTGRGAARPSRAARRRPAAARSRRRARRARSAPTISSSSSSSSITSICGHCSVKRRISSGRTRAPTDWKVPTRSVPGFARLERAEVGLRGLQARDDRLRVAQQQLAGLGQRDRARAARPLDEPLADDPLERRDLLADRRLRVAEPLRGASERALVRRAPAARRSGAPRRRANY